MEKEEKAVHADSIREVFYTFLNRFIMKNLYLILVLSALAKLKIEGILLTMTDSRTNYGKQISNLIRQAYGKHLKVFEQTIPRSVRAAETSAVGKSIFQHDPKGKVAEAYKSLAKEVQADADRQRKLSSERAR